jgi:hypothetical protein
MRRCISKVAERLTRWGSMVSAPTDPGGAFTAGVVN